MWDFINKQIDNITLNNKNNIYLKSIINEVLISNDYNLNNIYKSLALKNNTSSINIKNNISYIIKSNWSYINNYNLFNLNYNTNPTNKEIIFLLSEYIKKEYYYKCALFSIAALAASCSASFLL